MTKFSEFYENVRLKDAEPIRMEVEKLVSPQTFRNWSKGIYEALGQYWVQINEIATRYGYEQPYKL